MVSLYEELKINKYAEPALIFMGSKMKREKFIVNIDLMASFLDEIGVKQGESVGILSPNIPSSVIAFYAINKIGATANIFHPLVATNDLISKLEKCNTKYLFVYDMFYKKYRKRLKELGIKVIICSAKDYMPRVVKFVFSLQLDLLRGKLNGEYTVKDFTKRRENVSVKYVREACFLHSSGTEREKTAVITTENLAALKDKMRYVIGEENIANERALVSLPIFHCFGLGVGVHSCLTLGFSVLLTPRFKVKSSLRLIKRNKITMLIVIPSMVKKFIDNGFERYFDSVKHVYCGGDRISKSLVTAFNMKMENVNGIKLLEGYGLTELTGVCIVNTEKEYEEFSIGKPLKDIDILVVDEDKNVLGAEKVGELAICSNTVMQGYLDGEYVKVSHNGKSYILTGDLVMVDKNGFVFYKDRKKNVIKISGINVFPKDIEEIALSVDGIKEAVCVEREHDAKPYVYLYTVGDQDKKAEIIQKVNENTLKYYHLKDVIFLDSLPLNKNGKVDVKSLEKKIDYEK